MGTESIIKSNNIIQVIQFENSGELDWWVSIEIPVNPSW